jgi:aminoglycoside phosphotransferase (APT) family kinase protein
MHPAEILTDLTLVGRLLAAQFPQWASLPIEKVASFGTDNAMYRLGENMVVRLPRIHWAAKDVEREHEWLPRLAPHLPVAIPVPLGKGVPGEGYPYAWSIYRWLVGTNRVVGQLAKPTQLVHDLVKFLKTLQAIDPTDAPPAAKNGNLLSKDEEVRSNIQALSSEFDPVALSAVWQATLNTPKWAGKAVWVHSDMAPGNLLVVEGRLTAVIDFSGIGISDPACDLTIAWNLLSKDTRKLFRQKLGVDAASWARGRGWAFLQALGQLPYYRTTNPPLATSARHVLREVLADFEREN